MLSVTLTLMVAKAAHHMITATHIMAILTASTATEVMATPMEIMAMGDTGTPTAQGVEA